MNPQFDLFTLHDTSKIVTADHGTGKYLKDQGMKRAVNHANEIHDGWSAQAHSFLVDFIRIHEGEFMAEDVREKSRGIVPVPPTTRSWGAIIRKAAMNGVIKKSGHGTVKNPTAHSCFAAKWKRV